LRPSSNKPAEVCLISHPQTVDKHVGNHTHVTLLAPTPHGVADGLAIFGGCVQATQK